MYLYGIKLGEVYLLRTISFDKFETMLAALEPIKDALTIIKPQEHYGELE